MSEDKIVRAWKDPEYRNSLSAEQQAQLLENPVGMRALLDKDMEIIVGGRQRGTSKKGGCQTYNVTGGRKCSKKGSCYSC